MRHHELSRAAVLTTVVVFGGISLVVDALARPLIRRRDVAALLIPTVTAAWTAPAAIQPAASAAANTAVIAHSDSDPPPLLAIRGGQYYQGTAASTIAIPRVGYSLYKTSPDQAARCTTLALLAGVRHLDVGTLYGNNAAVGGTLRQYLQTGNLDTSAETPELLDLLQATRSAGDAHALARTTAVGAVGSKKASGWRARRNDLFVHHKVANAEQSVNSASIKKAVKATIAELGCSYFDMVSVHSPLTDKSRRLSTYMALLELCEAGVARSVGVCNYGLGPLDEIQQAGLPLPAMNQLELSPFNTHPDIVAWCRERSVAIGCGAWSKLSSTVGLQKGWDVIAEIAKSKGMTKAQVLVRWALQNNFICVPRSSSAYKIERIAIAQNSYGGVNSPDGGFVLTNEEMMMLDGLNVSWKAGSLGRIDGWDESDISGPDWDPTIFR